MDREKVIEALEHCRQLDFDMKKPTQDAIDDALALLKEQEPVPPEKQNDGNPGAWASWWYVCGNCGRDIDCYDKFCRSCGKAVKWE